MLDYGKIESAKRESAKTGGLFCPFRSQVNPNMEVVQADSVKWVRAQGLLSDAKRCERLAKSKIGHLVGRSFPHASRETLQIAADWTTLFCLLDDRVEVLASPSRVDAFLSTLLADFRSGRCESDEPMARALLDLRRRMSAIASSEWVARFAEHVHDIFRGFSWEAVNRAQRLLPELATYRAMRQITVGLFPQFHLSVLTDGIDMPSKIWDHAAIQRLMATAANCVGWANDLFTYEKELQAGEMHNLVFMLLDQAESLEQAVARAKTMHDDEVRSFLRQVTELPSFGPHNREVHRFVAVLAAWIRGHFDWAAETGRYKCERDIVEPAESGEFDLDGYLTLIGKRVDSDWHQAAAANG